MLNKLRQQYLNKELNDKEYDEELFAYHKILFEYVQFLKDTHCKALEISEKGILCRFDYGERQICMYLDEKDYCAVPAQIIGYGDYEIEETNMVMKMIQYLGENSVFFDIGANLGWYGINAYVVRPDLEIYMLEPVPETYMRLCENVSANDMSGTCCYNLGFYKENTQMDFYYDISASGASSLSDLRGLDTTKKIRCTMECMDDFVTKNQIKQLDFIKCDVEGAELFVYQGGFQAINKYKPIIFSEMLRKWCRKFQYHPNDIIELLASIGYECFIITGGEKIRKIERVTEETEETNYFFLHTQRHHQIITEMSERNNR